MTFLSFYALHRKILNKRLSYAVESPFTRLPRVPKTPSLTLRDPWRGNMITGVRFIQNQVLHDDIMYTLHPGEWKNDLWLDSYTRWLQSFIWLRDLRQMGTQSARQKARTLVKRWIKIPPSERPLTDPSITGNRIAILLYCYHFFADSANDNFKENLMSTILIEARSIMVLSKTVQGYKALAALKGLLAAAVSLPQYPKFLKRYYSLIDDVLTHQINPDGGHYSRSPEQQFLIVRELAEMLFILKTARLTLPAKLQETANHTAQALRAMRHSDGGLALFNGSTELDAQMIDQVINLASRSKVIAPNLPETGFVRMSNGRSVVIVDAASPTLTKSEVNAHAGMLSFEFSSARQRIIVNCGSSTITSLSEALRYPAAHSVLEITNLSPSYPHTHDTPSKRLKVTPKVDREHITENGNHWLQMSHNNYAHQGGGIYYRRLYLSRDGQNLRGEEQIENAHIPLSVKVRFHLHPNIMIKAAKNGYLLHTHKETWLFRANTRITVEESIYLGQGSPIPTLQLTLTRDHRHDYRHEHERIHGQIHGQVHSLHLEKTLEENLLEENTASTSSTTITQVDDFTFTPIRWALVRIDPS